MLIPDNSYILLLGILVVCSLMIIYYVMRKITRRVTDKNDMTPQDTLSVKESLEWMIKMFNPEIVAGWDITIQYDIKSSGQWYIEIKNARCTLNEGEHNSPNLTMKTDVETWMSIVHNKLSGEMAAVTGKLKAEGDMEIFLQHEEIFDRKRLEMILKQEGINEQRP